jgi:ATP-dependent Lhr-like helicase
VCEHDDIKARRALKDRLVRTWSAFFERHGNFTAIQRAAIPPLLDGHNVMVCAPTAGGKTEAALAPLIERHCPPVRPGSWRGGLSILYLTPTRALVNDLQRRLGQPCDALGLRVGVKTGDTSTFRASRPPDLLITTPESLDSLITAHPRLLAQLKVIVIDEVHLFEGTARADHVRVLLNRIRRIRTYAVEQGDAVDATIQYAALSATVADPFALARRYFADAIVVTVPGRRSLELEWLELAPDNIDALNAYWANFRARGWQKALVFCNSRAEVEAYAAAVRLSSPFGDAVFAHYSNIDARRRHEIEEQFAVLDVAICFASSTLELGIDIGAIDLVVMIGPPGSTSAFVQRAGRGNRRHAVQRVACAYRSPLEHLTFSALHAALTDKPLAPAGAFRPSVAIQQIFSLVKQSPMGSVRLAELERLFAGMLSEADVRSIVGQLQQLRYLRVGRPGEWRPGERLNELFDEQMSAEVRLSIYSNIESSGGRTVDIRDQLTQTVVARVDAQWFDRPVLTLEGRPVNVEWFDGESLLVSAYRGHDAAKKLIYRSAKQLLSYAVARHFPTQLGLLPNQAPYVVTEDGVFLFHWLGDVYGKAALDLVRYRIAAEETDQPGLCLQLADEPVALPVWSAEQVVTYLHDAYRGYEPLLELGPYHHLLPPALRQRAVVEQFDVGRFHDAVNAMEPVAAPESLAADLLELVAP